MIAARKVPLFNFMLRRRLTAVIRRRFHNVYLLGADHLRSLDPARPVVACANHTNWWDGFVLYVLSHLRLPHDIYLAMEEKNLRRYRFFTWMGVFGIDLASPRAALSGLRYAVRLLKTTAGTPRLLWLFVQGRLLDPRVPVEVRPGALFLAQRTGAQILPLAIRYEWLAESRPSIFVHFGSPMPPETSGAELAATLNCLFARIESALDTNAKGELESLFPPRMSMNKRWDYVVHLLIGRGEVFDKQNR